MTIESGLRSTLDTNVIFYALTENAKTGQALRALRQCSFLSVQVFNEYAHSSVRKRKRTLVEAMADLQALSEAVPNVAPIEYGHHREALHIAQRFQLSFYDSLMIAVALANGATTFYSEDMQHGMIIDDRLTISNPFLQADTQ